jgi:hypothetical protein
MATTPRREQITSLPTEPGTAIHFISPDLAVVVEQQAGTGARPKVRVCKCIRTEFKCTTDANNVTTCREECTGWECTTIEGGGPA